MADQNFEPFIDWDGLTDEMADDLYQRVDPYREATDRLLKMGRRRGYFKAATRLLHLSESNWAVQSVDGMFLSGMRSSASEILRLQSELGALGEAIIRTLVTIPMMVHLAGPKAVEPCEGGDHDHHVQRCSRCGSTLQFWREGIMTLTPSGPHELEEDEIKWWEPGTLVAKSGADAPGVSMYEVEPGRKLEKHEMVCVDLSELMK